MGLVVEGGINIDLPKLFPVNQHFKAPQITNIEDCIKKELNKDQIKKTIKPGTTVAIGVGSRGITNIDVMLKALIHQLQDWGAKPFIVPAMGSHGGATGEGQQKLLSTFGIDEESMGVHIISTMDAQHIGSLECGMPLYMDTQAYQADAIVFINRIKPHTGFKGDHESGLLKMMAVGLGRHAGATAIHQRPFIEFPKLLSQMAEMYIEKTPIAFGIAVLENAYDQTAEIIAVPARELICKDKELLNKSKEYMPTLLLENIDVLVVSEIGKNISGAGMDPNITGKAASKAPQKFNAPSIERIVVLGLSMETKGNATGLGVADVITKKVYESINLDHTYANVITAKLLESGKIPMMMENDKEAISVALKTCFHANIQKPRIVWIKNTLELKKIWVSEPMLEEVSQHKKLEIIGEPEVLNFDNAGFVKEKLARFKQ